MKLKIFGSVSLITFITVCCSIKCNSPACNEYILVNGYSGNNFLMHYSYIEDLDSVWIYSYRKLKVKGYNLVLKLEKENDVIFNCNSNKITRTLKDSLTFYHNKINKIVFKDFIIIDNKGNEVKSKANKQISIIYFPIEYLTSPHNIKNID